MLSAARLNTLQHRSRSEAGTEPPLHTSARPALARVLLVDDQPANLVALSAVLASLGQELVTASSGADALRHLLSGEFACALFDVRMPGMGGVELVRMLRQRERTRHLPVLLLTAADYEETEVLAAYEEGAVDFLPKPVNPTVLRAKVRTFVDLYQREKAVAHEELLLRERQRADALARALREKQEALEAGEAQLRRIVESSLLGLFTADDAGRILDANDTFLKLVGYTREELAAGRLHRDALAPPEYRQARTHAVSELKAHGIATPYEKEYVRKDGGRIQVLVGSSRLVDQQRNMTFVLDVSARKAAERRMHFLSEASELLASSLDAEAVLERLAGLAVPTVADWCAVDLLEADGHVRRLSLCHADPRKVEFVRALDRRFPLDRHSPSVPVEVLKTGRPQYIADVSEEDLQRSIVDPGMRERVRALGLRSYLCVPLTARGRVLGALTLASAESQRRYGEEDLRLAEDLARRAATAMDNARLYAEVQCAVSVRDEFLSVATHELKTPLTSLKLQHQLILRSLGPEAAEAVGDRMTSAVRQVDRLAALIENLLDVSRISTGRLTLAPVPMDLAQATRDAVDRLRAVFAQAGCAVEVEVQAGAALEGEWDPLRLDQVLVNLLSNAAKYGAGKPVHVRVWAEQGRGKVSVRDEGIGIDPEAQTRIFGRFERAVSERHYGGLGLGLYISRQIVDALGGSISVDSVPEQGATFTVELPLKDSQEA